MWESSRPEHSEDTPCHREPVGTPQVTFGGYHRPAQCLQREGRWGVVAGRLDAGHGVI